MHFALFWKWQFWKLGNRALLQCLIKMITRVIPWIIIKGCPTLTRSVTFFFKNFFCPCWLFWSTIFIEFLLIAYCYNAEKHYSRASHHLSSVLITRCNCICYGSISLFVLNLIFPLGLWCMIMNLKQEKNKI